MYMHDTGGHIQLLQMIINMFYILSIQWNKMEKLA